MTTLSNRLEKNWRNIIGSEFEIGDYVAMDRFLQGEEDAEPKRTFYPKREEIFNALNLTPFEKVKVVIVGQDPYYRKGLANGLCFSVPKRIGIRDIPRSLQNIYKQIEAEYGEKPPHGDLTRWATQGVLLLNAALTVQEGKAGSHQRLWEDFTDAIIHAVSEKHKHLVFLLWGLDAQKKGARERDGVALIDRDKHLVLKTWHPAARSPRCRFLGCGHFKEANAYLMEHRLKPIDWQDLDL